jgi:hypothetical protein
MPDPTDAQIVKVLEITGESGGEDGYETISTAIDDLSDGQWARALELITAWDAEYEAGASSISVRGGNGVYYLPTEAGNDIRSRMRLLLGYPEYRDASITGIPTTTAIATEYVF